MKAFIVIAAVAALTNAEFHCPASIGFYEDPKQCDKYYECIDGVPTEHLCPDGLVFDSGVRYHIRVNRCDQLFNVDCKDRTILQPPQPTTNCPRRNGLFPHPDPYICDFYFNCVNGEAFEMMCSDGLHFDKTTGTCVWSESSGRKNCVRTILKTEDGFQCPSKQEFNAHGQLIIHPKYAHPTDCQRFYVCMNGMEPRHLGCPFGFVYNDVTEKCDKPQNVPGCENWYKDVEQTP